MPEKTYTLEITDSERRWLRGLLQNPPNNRELPPDEKRRCDLFMVLQTEEEKRDKFNFDNMFRTVSDDDIPF